MTAQSSTRLAVIGAGPGGYAAAFLAADLGMEVAMIDPGAHPGGVCLYRGCIPSKALLHVARLIGETREAAEFGVDFGKPKIDLGRLRAWKDGVVEKLTGGLGKLARRRKVRFIQGRARFRDNRSLSIDLAAGGTEVLAFENAILATGSRPATLPLLPAGSSRILDSTSALEVKTIPPTLLVVGGGYIGLELGSVYATLGSRVTLVEMTDALLPGADPDLVQPLEARIREAFESVLLGCRVAEVKEKARGVRVTLEGGTAGGSPQTFDAVLVAVGRRPNVGDLGLENTAVDLDDAGFVKVDGQRRSADETIFAIGDVAGEPMLAHKASHEGRTAVEAIAGSAATFSPQAVPAVVFTDPEIAWCGLTEMAAKEADRPVKVARYPWGASGRAATLGRTDGVTKLILDPDTDRILGVGIAGSGAGELIAEGVLAVEMAALASDLKFSIHPHPTLSETVMEAAEVHFGQSTHVFRPRRG